MSVLIALSTREDVALAVIVMGVVLWWWLRRHAESAAPPEVSESDSTRPDTAEVRTPTTKTTDNRTTNNITTDNANTDNATTAAKHDAAEPDAPEPAGTHTGSPEAPDPAGGHIRSPEAPDPAGGHIRSPEAPDPAGGHSGSPEAPEPAGTHTGNTEARDRRLALLVSALGVVWYVVATRLLIPAFNRGLEPFYIEYFYGHYGSNTREIVESIMTRPDRVVSDATQPDRIRFYRDLLVPWGGLPLGGLAELAMAGPQMLASVIGTSPYARSIRYQYTSVMIAPITIAAIEGAAWMWRHRFVRRYLVPWLLVCAYVSNVAWSPSPISANDGVWAQESPRHDSMRTAVDLVPPDATVSATYSLLPHLSHREQIYNWPNPWVPSYWSNDDTYRLPDPSTIEYLVVDRLQVGGEQAELLESLIGPDGDYEVILDRDDVIVARRR